MFGRSVNILFNATDVKIPVKSMLSLLGGAIIFMAESQKGPKKSQKTRKANTKSVENIVVQKPENTTFAENGKSILQAAKNRKVYFYRSHKIG